MIRRLSSLFSRWVGDDPHPEPSHLDVMDRMVEPVVVPELEPDPLPDHPGLREWALMDDAQRVEFIAAFRAQRAADEVVAAAERITREAVQP